MNPLRTIASAGGSYPVYVARGAVASLAEVVDASCRRGRRFAVVSRRVLELHRARLDLDRFELVPVEDGEEQKDLEAANRLLGELIARGARRDSVVVAIGGGTVGDLAGFVASILLRGVDLVHVPTTLLAQVDSSIGGKVGVNHALGKNLVGSFWPPRAVVADPAFLETLPEREMVSGRFEALKAGVIGDPELFALSATDDLEEIVRRAIGVKGEIVSADEREGDRRRLLNYGHTIGHGIEAALGFRGLTHGEAVGWGMIGANAIASARGLLAAGERERIDAAIRGLRPRPAKVGAAAVLEAIERDKKFTATARVMVLPRRVGACAIVEDVTEEELRQGVEAAMS